MLHVRQGVLLKMALKFSFKLTERLYLSNGFRVGVVSSSAVYSEAPLILSSFFEGRAQQITASGFIALGPVVQRPDNFIQWISHYPTVSICAKITVFRRVQANMHPLTTV